MRPQEINVTLGSNEAQELLGEITADNRALRLVLAKYLDRYGVLPELGGATPEPPAEADVTAEPPAPEDKE